jgi:L-aminopeptidase/D-esterase-like protein
MRPGPRNLITDVSGLLVGNATDSRRRTGVTVVLGEAPVVASVAAMGGAPGTRETDMLEPDKSVAAVDAFVLAGGSAFGLDAAGGVMAGLRAKGRGFQILDQRIPLVPAAIVFDLLNGGDKDWDDSPYPALGRAALDAAAADFELGTAGAGAGSLTGMLKGGLGSASTVLGDGTTVGALAVVNAVGSANTPGERHFWAAPFELDAEFGGLGPDPRSALGLPFVSAKATAYMERANTTIAVVATDATLTKAQAKRMAVMAHDGIARAVVPSHLPSDGDLVFAAATGTRSDQGGEHALHVIGHAASLTLARAIARGVYAARSEPGDLLPSWQNLNR